MYVIKFFYGEKNIEILTMKIKMAKKPQIWLFEYKNDFQYPSSEVSFHWWNNKNTLKHCHNYYEIIIITEGKTRHTLNGAAAELNKGNMLFIHPTDCHEFSPIEDYNAQHLNIALTEGKLNALCELLFQDREIINDFFNFTVLLSESELEYFINNANQINLIKNTDSKVYERTFSLITLEMIIEALSIFYKRRLHVSLNYPEWFNDLLHKLNSPEAFSYTIEDIYQISNYSPTMLVKYFKEYTGHTIIGYITKIKMNYACNMLLKTNFTVLDIASKLSYNSISHFNKLFKKYTGKTPLQYRKYMSMKK